MLRLTLVLAVGIFLIASCNERNDSSYLNAIYASQEAANVSMSHFNHYIYRDIEGKLESRQTVDKARIWKPKADTVRRLSYELIAYLNNIKAAPGWL